MDEPSPIYHICMVGTKISFLTDLPARDGEHCLRQILSEFGEDPITLHLGRVNEKHK
jgi:hypothetical protein